MEGNRSSAGTIAIHRGLPERLLYDYQARDSPLRQPAYVAQAPQSGLASDPIAAPLTFLRVARLSRNIGQPDHTLFNPVTTDKAERRPRSGEIWLAVTKDDGMQVDSILIDQAKFG